MVDETYLRVGGQWAFLYRAVDESGQVVDVLLSEKRALESAEHIFERLDGTRQRRSTDAPGYTSSGHSQPSRSSVHMFPSRIA